MQFYMQIVSNILLFIVGAFIGMVFFHTAVIRILYFLPKSIYLSAQGMIKPVCIFIVLVVPILPFVVAFAIGYFFPYLPDYLNEHPIIGLAANLNTIWLCFKYLCTERGRLMAKGKFWLIVLRYTTAKGHDHLKMEREKEKAELVVIKEMIEERLK